ncbi:MAG: hypothetical protein RL653_2635 [Pseudomonadota bacterium]
MARYFISQQKLEDWILAGRADVQSDRLVVPGEGRSFGLGTAYHFKALVAGEDAAQLLDRVKTAEQLRGLGAEVLSDSVVLGEAAYEVTPGFVTEASVATLPPRPASPATPTARPPAEARPKNKTEADLLAEFLLGNLK